MIKMWRLLPLIDNDCAIVLLLLSAQDQIYNLPIIQCSVMVSTKPLVQIGEIRLHSLMSSSNKDDFVVIVRI